MLESVVSSILERLLGDFVEGFHSGNVNLSLFSSSSGITLNKLTLKTNAINALLDLPIVIQHGSIGSIHLSIPWSNLANKPTIIRLGSIFCLAQPSTAYHSPFDAQQAELAIQKAKLKQLAAVDAAEAGTAAADQSFVQRTITAILANLQVFVDTVHVRFEDCVTDATHPFAFGFTLDAFSAQACDIGGAPSSANVVADIIHKIINVRNLSVYWNSRERALTFDSVEQLMAQLARMLPTDAAPVKGNSYLLEPFNASVQLSMKKSDVPDLQVAKYSFVFDFDALELVLNSAQYRDMLRVLAFLSSYQKKANYREQWSRAAQLGASVSRARRLWAYGTACALADVQRHNAQYSWPAIKAFAVKRRAFVRLRTLELRGVQQSSAAYTSAEAELGVTMKELIEALSFESIMFLRALTSMLQKQTASKESSARAVKSARPAPEKQSSGWFSGWFGASADSKKKKKKKKKKNNKDDDDDDNDDDGNAIVLNKDEWQEFYAAIGYTGEKQVAKAGAPPPEYVFLRFAGDVQRGGLRLEQFVADGANKALSMLSFERYHVDYTGRPSSLTLSGSLRSLVCVDCATPNPYYANIVDRLVSGKPSAVRPKRRVSNAPKPKPLLSFQIDQQPLDKENVDLHVEFAVQPLLVVYNYTLINRFVQFFDASSISNSVSSDIEALAAQSSAAVRLRSLRLQTEQRFALAIEHQKQVSLHIDIAAPRLIAPRYCSRDKPFSAAVVDLGHFTLNSVREPASSAMRDEGERSNANGLQEKAEYYDWFRFELAKMNCGLAHDAQFVDYELLFEPISLSCDMALCKIRSGTLLTLARIDADLDRLHLTLSAAQINALLQISRTLTKEIAAKVSNTELSLAYLEAQRRQQAQERERRESQLQGVQQDQLQQEQIILPEQKKPNESDSELLAKVTKLRVSFRVNSIQLTLIDSARDKFVEASLEQLSTTLVQRSLDFELGARLTAISLLDHKASGARRQLIVTPEANASDFVRLRYLATDKQSPHYRSGERYDHFVTLDIARALEAAVNRDTIVRLAKFADEAFDLPAELALPVSKAEPPAGSDEAAAVIVDETVDSWTSQRMRVKLSLTLHRVALRLYHDGQTALAALSLHALACGVELKTSGELQLHATLGGVRLDDLLSDSNVEQYRKVFHATGQEIVEFKLTLLSAVQRKANAAHNRALLQATDSNSSRAARVAKPLAADGTVEAHVHSMRLVLVGPFFVQLLMYVEELQALLEENFGAGGAQTTPTTAATGGAAATTVSTNFLFGFDVALDDLDVMVPCGSKTLDALVLDLGDCKLRNVFVPCDGAVENARDGQLLSQVLEIDLSALTLIGNNVNQDELPAASQALSKVIIEPVDVHVGVEIVQPFHVALAATQRAAREPMRVEIAVGCFAMHTDPDSMELLISAMLRNLFQLPDELLARESLSPRMRKRIENELQLPTRAKKADRKRSPLAGGTSSSSSVSREKKKSPRKKSPRKKSPRKKSPRKKSPRKKSPRKKSPRIDSSPAVVDNEARAHDSDDVLGAEPIIEAQNGVDDEPFATMLVDLRIDTVALTVATMHEHELSKCFELQVQAIGIDLCMSSDERMTGSVALGALSVRDVRRRAKTAFRDLIATRIDSIGELATSFDGLSAVSDPPLLASSADEAIVMPDAMVHVAFDMSQNVARAKQHYDVRLCDLTLMLLPETLMHVQAWAFPFLDQLLVALDAYNRFRLALARNMQSLPITRGPPSQTLTASVKLRRSGFALVEDVTSESSNGLCGVCELDVMYNDVQQRGEQVQTRKQSAKVLLTANVHKCVLREPRATALPLIDEFCVDGTWSTGLSWRVPTRIELLRGEQPQMHQTDPTLINLRCHKPIDVVLSYRDIMQLMTISASFAAAAAADSQPDAPAAAAAAAAAAAVAGLADRELNLVRDQRTLCNFELGRVHVTLVDDLEATRHEPLLAVVLNLSLLDVRDWHTSNAMKANVVGSVSADHYNLRGKRWETLLEPWSFELRQAGVRTVLQSHSKLDLTIAKPFVDALLKLSDVIERSGGQLETADQLRLHHAAGMRLRTATDSDVVLRNESGLNFHYRVGAQRGTLPMQHAVLESGCVAALDLNSAEQKRRGGGGARRGSTATLRTMRERKASDEHAPVCSITFRDCEPTLPAVVAASRREVADLPLLQSGTGEFAIRPFGDRRLLALYKRLAKVDSAAAHEIAVRAPLEWRNNSDEPIELIGSLPSSVRGGEWRRELAPGAHCSVPMVLFAFGAVALRPACVAGEEPSHFASAALRCGQGLLRGERLGKRSSSSSIDVLGRGGLPAHFALRCASTRTKDTEALDWHCAVSVKTRSVRMSGAHGRTLAYTVSVEPAFRFENLLPHAIKLRLQCRKSNTILLETSVEIGATHGVHCVANPHWPVLLAARDEPKLAFARRGQHELVLSTQLPGFKWSDDALLLRGARKRRSGMSFGQQCRVESANVLPALDFYQRKLNVRMASAVTALTMTVSLYCDVWLVNRTGVPLHVRTADGRPAADGSGHASAEWHASLSLDCGEPRDWYRGTFAGDEPPLMLSSDKCRVRVADSEWSRDWVQLSAAEGGVLSLPQRADKNKTRGLYELSAALQVMTSERFFRTKRLVFAARHVLFNRTNAHLLLAQEGAASCAPVSLLRGEQTVWHWRDASAPRLLRLTTAEDGWHWSGAVDVYSLGETMLCLRSSHDISARKFIAVHRKLADGQTLVFLTSGDVKRPRFVIENRLARGVLVSQANLDNVHPPTQIGARQRVPFAWDEPAGTHALILEVDGVAQDMKVTLDELDVLLKHPDERSRVTVVVTAEGPTRVMVVEQMTGRQRRERVDSLRSEEASANSAAQSASAAEFLADELVEQAVSLELAGVSVSLVDRSPKELLLVSVSKLHYESLLTATRETLEVLVESLQIDNQLFASSPLSSVTLFHDTLPDKPFFKLAYVKLRQQVALDYYEYFSVLVQEMHVDVDEPLLMQLIKFVSSDLVSKQMIADDERYLIEHERAQPPCGLNNERALQQAAAAVDTMIYFRLLHINPMRINLTFRAGNSNSGALHKPSRKRAHGGGGGGESDSNSDDDNNNNDDDDDDDDKAEQHVHVSDESTDTLEKMLRVSGTVGLSNINNAPLRLNCLMLKHPFATWSEFESRIQQHYTQQMLRQLHRLVGSSAAIGDPVGLVSNLGAGVRDFFYAPAQGLVESPAAFGRGVAVGTLSLVENTVYGIFNTVSGVSASAAQGMSALSFDDDYRRERDARRAAQHADHAGKGVMLGATSVARGLWQGVSGVVAEPVRGAKKGGVLGFAKGIGRGVAGVVVKPMVGISDAVADVSAGIKNTTSIAIVRPIPRRWPRECGDRRKPMQPYNAERAFAQVLLASADHDTDGDGVVDAGEARMRRAQMMSSETLLQCWRVSSTTKRRIGKTLHTVYLVMSDERLVAIRAKDVRRDDKRHAKYFHSKSLKCTALWSVALTAIDIEASPTLVPPSSAAEASGEWTLQFAMTKKNKAVSIGVDEQSNATKIAKKVKELLTKQ